MKIAIFSALLLLGLVSGAPTTKDDTLVITKEFFADELKIYEGKHDIVKVYVPLNSLNFEDNAESEEVLIFFVEADINGNENTDQGLYVKTGDQVTKLLKHGRDIAAPRHESKLAYFAAQDGIYVYDHKEKKAVKYGKIDDDLIGIVMGNNTNSMYILTADKKVYKVSEDGNNKEQVAEIKNAEQIVMDFAENLFYLDSDKKVYAVTADGVKLINGLPENASKITLIRPPFVLEEGVPVVVDRKTFTVFVNGTVEEQDFVLDVNDITAYSMEATLLQYYAREKKIYEYNVLALILSEMLSELKDFFDNIKDDINNIAGKSKGEFLNH